MILVFVIDCSKPMMDLLIKICAQLKFNPADYTLQIFPRDSSWPVSYKANQTFASVGMNNIVKLISKRTERVEEKQNSQRPFEVFAIYFHGILIILIAIVVVMMIVAITMIIICVSWCHP